MLTITPVHLEPTIQLWARLVIVEQFSLAIVDWSFPIPESKRARKRRALQAAKIMRSDSNESHPAP